MKSFKSFVVNENTNHPIQDDIRQIVMPLIDEGFEMQSKILNGYTPSLVFTLAYDSTIKLDYRSPGQSHKDGEVETQESIDDAFDEFSATLRKTLIMMDIMPEINDRIFDKYSKEWNIVVNISTAIVQIVLTRIPNGWVNGRRLTHSL